jgi:DNA-binding MarR family transcriptional regulator
MVSEPRWLNDSEARTWRAYRRMRALLDLQLGRDLARASGFSEADYDVLSNVSEAQGQRLRLSELAALMLWSTSRLSHQVTRMEQRGLVERVEDESDARGAFVILTNAGWKAIRAAAPGHVESVREHFIDLLTADEIEVLGDISVKVVDHLRDRQRVARNH